MNYYKEIAMSLLQQGHSLKEIIESDEDIKTLAKLFRDNVETQGKERWVNQSSNNPSLPPEQENNPPQKPTRFSLLGFGKYSNKTWNEVLTSDREYLLWVEQNTDRKIPIEILEELVSPSKRDRSSQEAKVYLDTTPADDDNPF